MDKWTFEEIVGVNQKISELEEKIEFIYNTLVDKKVIIVETDKQTKTDNKL